MLGFYLSAYSPLSATRKLYDPDGNVISTTGSLSGGINEGIAAAVANGFPFKCFPGGGDIDLKTYLTVPPCGETDIDLGATGFHVLPECNGPGLYMSSFNGGRFEHHGRIRYSGTGTCAYYIAPAAADPVYGQHVIQNARIKFGWLQVTGVSIGQAVVVDPSQGSLIQNEIDWGVLQGWDGNQNCFDTGIYVTGVPNLNFGVNENHFRVKQLIGYSRTGLQIGGGSPNDLYIGDNDWLVESNPTGVGAQQPVMAITYASYDRWCGAHTVYTGSSPHSIIFSGAANHSRFQLRQDTSSGGVQGNGLTNTAF